VRVQGTDSVRRDPTAYTTGGRRQDVRPRVAGARSPRISPRRSPVPDDRAEAFPVGVSGVRSLRLSRAPTYQGDGPLHPTFFISFIYTAGVHKGVTLPGGPGRGAGGRSTPGSAAARPFQGTPSQSSDYRVSSRTRKSHSDIRKPGPQPNASSRASSRSARCRCTRSRSQPNGETTLSAARSRRSA
jgi:hypothetical protein